MGELPPGAPVSNTPRSPSIQLLIQVIEELERPEKKRHRDMLASELARAKALLRQLDRAEKVKALHFDSPILRTLRQIREPTQQLHDVIVAFFLLLGEYEGYTRVFLDTEFLFLVERNYFTSIF